MKIDIFGKPEDDFLAVFGSSAVYLDVLIDDHPGTILDVAELPACRPWLILRPYNQHVASWVRGLGGKAAETLEECLEVL